MEAWFDALWAGITDWEMMWFSVKLWGFGCLCLLALYLVLHAKAGG